MSDNLYVQKYDFYAIYVGTLDDIDNLNQTRSIQYEKGHLSFFGIKENTIDL